MLEGTTSSRISLRLTIREKKRATWLTASRETITPFFHFLPTSIYDDDGFPLVERRAEMDLSRFLSKAARRKTVATRLNITLP